jgi:hypothetical protein
LVKIENR